ncbi:MAG: helix-turn-helix domain-containing protein [Patescibacteria group bacterium]|nr:helix-turn-helix domain-containing protein [Patescibacteria group bacterium]
MNDNKSFQEALKDAISFKGMDIERLAEITGVPKNYLAAFVSGDFKKLPPPPYVRGYLMKVSAALGIDADYLWNIYKKEITPEIKGSDKLPVNRFAPQRKSRKKAIMLIAAFFVIIYLAFRIDDIIGIPKMEIIRPANNGEIVNEQFIKLSGNLNNFFDKLTINNEEVPVEKNGNFEKEYQLQPGINKIEFKVKRFLGKEIKVEREIIYQQNF